MNLEGNAKSTYELRGRIGACDKFYVDAYAVAVRNGFEGTEKEWLESLKGEKGDQGEQGETGKVIIEELTEEEKELLKGNPFTYEDFTPEQLAALKGEKGDKGDPGEKGEAFHYEDFTAEQMAGLKGDDGYTPVKGVDYWNAADIAEIKSYVDEAILGGAW